MSKRQKMDPEPQKSPNSFQLRVKSRGPAKVLHKRNLTSVKNFEKKKEKADLRLPCCCYRASWTDYPHLQDTLPEGFDYRVCHYTSLEGEDDPTGSFHVELRLPFLPTDRVLVWKKQLEDKTMCLFRTCRTYACTGHYNCYKRAFACQRGLSKGTGIRSSVKTGCETKYIITVRRPLRSGLGDNHMPDFPTSIEMTWKHNHPRNTALPFRSMDLNEDTKKQFISLYHQGHTPSSALLLYRTKLMRERGESHEILSQDKRIWPEKSWVRRLFQKMKNKEPPKKVVVIPADVTKEILDTIEGQQAIPYVSLVTPSPMRPDRAIHPTIRNVVDVILPAAGTSTRMGQGGDAQPKQFQKVLGSHLIAYTVECFHRIPWIRHIVLVVSPTQQELALDLAKVYDWSKVIVCPGSTTRHRSIMRGVEALKEECCEDSVVIIHDGARPFVPEETIDRVVTAAEEHGASGVVRPLVSTVVKPDKNDVLESTLIRTDYRNSEMPQAFQYHIIAKAYRLSTDYDLDFGTECLLLAVQHASCHASLVHGGPDLWKVTYVKDLLTMESVVKEKFTRLSVAVKTAQAVSYLGKLMAGLEERKIVTCGVKNRTANTSICFLDLPDAESCSPSRSNLYVEWARHVSDHYRKLPGIHRRMGLYVVLVFVASSNNHRYNNKDEDEEDNDDRSGILIHDGTRDTVVTVGEFDDEEDEACPPLHNASSSSSSLLPKHPPHQQQPQQQQQQPPPQQPSNPLLQQQKLLQQQQKLLLQQLKLLQEQQRLIEQQLHSSSSSSHDEQQLTHDDHLNNIDNNTQIINSNNNTDNYDSMMSSGNESEIDTSNENDLNHHRHHHHSTRLASKAIQPRSYRREQPPPFLSRKEDEGDQAVESLASFEPVGTISKISQESGSSSSRSNSNTTKFQIRIVPSSSPQKKTIVRKRKERNDGMQETVNSSSSSGYYAQSSDSRGVHDPYSSNLLSSRRSETNRVSNSMLPRIRVCRDFMKEVREMFGKEGCSVSDDFCVASILSQNEEDLTSKLVEIVWNRSRVLDGQVLVT